MIGGDVIFEWQGTGPNQLMEPFICLLDGVTIGDCELYHGHFTCFILLGLVDIHLRFCFPLHHHHQCHVQVLLHTC